MDTQLEAPNYTKEKMTLSQRLLSMRLELRLRQKEMAAKLDVPVCTYRSWEKGSATPRALAMAELNRRIDSGFKEKSRM